MSSARTSIPGRPDRRYGRGGTSWARGTTLLALDLAGMLAEVAHLMAVRLRGCHPPGLVIDRRWFSAGHSRGRSSGVYRFRACTIPGSLAATDLITLLGQRERPGSAISRTAWVLRLWLARDVGVGAPAGAVSACYVSRAWRGQSGKLRLRFGWKRDEGNGCWRRT